MGAIAHFFLTVASLAQAAPAAQGWPDVSNWSSFDDIWNINVAASPGACKWLGLVPNSDKENNALKAAIKQAGTDSDLDARFILVTVFQESAGCVRVKTSYSPNEGRRNPGLLQGPDGPHTCNDEKKGIKLNPCPDAQIKGMITDGVGLTMNDGLKQTVARSKAKDVSRYYKGALLYNSGVMPSSGNLGKGRSNPCYSSDIANRLMGWVADSSPCNKKTIGNL
uniref:Transglycosylase SLT domain-containing protein n=1 Tax=Bionectria ochroleuca TaxID=29856 RepID=A0A0B7KQ68_BIOOC